MENLKIFRGNDYNLNATLDTDGVLEASVYLDEVSTGLYESSTIFFLEAVEYNDSIYLSKPISNSALQTKFEFEWKDDIYESADLIMYGAKIESGITKIQVKSTDSFKVLDSTTSTGVNSDNLKIVTTLNSEAIQVNVALNSETEGRHHRTLLVYSNDSVDRILVARILFYGEVEGEDDRLRVLLQNLGSTLDEGDFILFKEHDITEMSPDYILLNQKRRELLLELSNIRPFIGTYKAILNAIDFFGYNNLTLKEYWLNINTGSNSFGKLHAVPVPNSSKHGDAVRKAMTIKVPNSNLKKTSRFSLVYKINTANGGVDEWDIPTVDEVFDFTPEEVLIKLYGLKNKLQREYLPLNAKIVDITGEGDYFAQKNLNVWNNQNAIAFFTEGIDINYTSFPNNRNLYIEDVSLVLRKVYDPNDIVGTGNNDFNAILNTKFEDYETLSSSQLADLRTAINSFYSTYYDDSLETLNEDIQVGCPVILDGEKTFDTIWDSGKFTWNDSIDPQVTWNNWWKRWVYEIEWIISGPNDWNHSFRGNIDDYLKFPIFLPYNGEYSVEMRTYDLFGHRSYDFKKDMISVNLKEVEIYGFYKTLGLNKWEDRDSLKWNQIGGYWDLPAHNEKIIQEADASWYLALDRANYVHDNVSPGDENFSTVSRYDDIYSDIGYSETPGPYYWDNCDFAWNWTNDIWWEATRIGNDLTASFLIKDIENGSVLTINHLNPTLNIIQTGNITISSNTPTSINDLAGWRLITDELNNSTDPIISKFNYNIVERDIDGNNLPGDQADVVSYILAVGKQYSKTYDFESITITDGEVGGEFNQVTYNPTFDEIDIFSDWREVNRSTHVTFCTDNSKMPGMKLVRWKITNNTYSDNSDIYYDDIVLTYLFKYPGDYTITLETEDTNGNINTSQRNILKVK